MDNVFIERLWRSLKYEDVYLKGYGDGVEARAGIGAWLAFYNEHRLHQALGYRAPMAIFREGVVVGTCGHVDNALPCEPNRKRRALTTCPQEAQKQQQTGFLEADSKPAIGGRRARIHNGDSFPGASSHDQRRRPR